MPNIERILLVDDDDDFVLLLKTAFELAGFKGEISVAGDPAAAADHLTGSKGRSLPDLVVLDLRLHSGSGFEVLRLIRSRPDLNTVTVSVLTGVEIEGEMRKAYELGANEYLVKPLEFSRLIEVADRLRGEGVAQEVASHAQ